MVVNKKLILASRSPRRQALLKQLGLRFEVSVSGVDEHVVNGSHPDEYVMKLSYQKAAAVASKEKVAIVIGADTIVVLDGEILNKPGDEHEARRMLARLSGRVHKVYTGFTIIDCPSLRSVSEVEVTNVRFRTLLEDEIAAYVRSGSPMDKAGGYGIQDDYGAVFVDRIEGCFYNVVGFPLAKFYETLQKFDKANRTD